MQKFVFIVVGNKKFLFGNICCPAMLLDSHSSLARFLFSLKELCGFYVSKINVARKHFSQNSRVNFLLCSIFVSDFFLLIGFILNILFLLALKSSLSVLLTYPVMLFDSDSPYDPFFFFLIFFIRISEINVFRQHLKKKKVRQPF